MQPLHSSSSRAPVALQAVLLALTAAALVAPATAAGRPGRFSPAPEAPAAEPNVTAFSGRGSLLGGAAHLAAAAAAPWLPSGLWSGEGTAYGSGKLPNSGSTFACSFRYLNDWASHHYAAINKPMWDEGRACGRCITAWCVDERCATRNQRVQVMVTDLCPECKHGDVDFSIPVYRDITGMWPHRLAVEWEWSDCSANMEGPIRMHPKDGINAQWQAFYFSNTRWPLKSVTLNGTPLQRNEFQFWVHAAPLAPGPAQLVFEAENGARLTASAPDPLAPQELPNFELQG